MSSLEVPEPDVESIEEPEIDERLLLRARALCDQLKEIERKAVEERVQERKHDKDIHEEEITPLLKVKESSSKDRRGSILPYIFLILILGIVFGTFYLVSI